MPPLRIGGIRDFHCELVGGGGIPIEGSWGDPYRGPAVRASLLRFGGGEKASLWASEGGILITGQSGGVRIAGRWGGDLHYGSVGGSSLRVGRVGWG